MKKCVEKLRAVVSVLFSSVGLFVCIQFLIANVLIMDFPVWYRESFENIRRFVILPWGFGLGMMCIAERSRHNEPVRWSFALLALLVAWITLPFAVRFGYTADNVSSWYNAFVAFFGIYVPLAAKKRQERERELDIFCWLMMAVSLIWGGVLVFCAANAYVIDLGDNGYGFGVDVSVRGCLCSGMHYNLTGMMALCGCFINMTGFARSRHKAAKVLFALGAALMVIVVVLTQSRTARYALLLTAAFGAFTWCFSRMHQSRKMIRLGISAALACAILAGGFLVADLFTNAAVNAYSEKGIVAKALAEEQKNEEKKLKDDLVVRSKGDAGFSERTLIWKNAIRYWKANPKYLLIGCGVERIGKHLIAGTSHERAGTVKMHNTYLQFIADYGLIGASMLAVFLLMMIKPLCLVFFSRESSRIRGQRCVAMLTISLLIVGLMESLTLTPMSLINGVFMLSLAMLDVDIKTD